MNTWHNTGKQERSHKANEHRAEHRPEEAWSQGHSASLPKFVASKVLFLGLKTWEGQQ